MPKVKCKDLKFADYQRPVSNYVDKIVKNFDPRLLDPIKCVMRDDGLYVIDGQHRVAALLKLFGDEATVEASVYKNISPEEEAQLFYQYNSSKKALTHNEKLKASFYSGDEKTKKYVDALNSSLIEWTFGSKSGSKKPIFVAHNSGMKVFEKYGADVLIRTLNIIALSEDKEYTNGMLVRALAIIIYYCPSINDTKLLKVLTSQSWEEHNKAGRTYGKIYSSGYSFSGAIPIAMGMVDLYNNKFQKRKAKFTISLDKEV